MMVKHFFLIIITHNYVHTTKRSVIMNYEFLIVN